MALPSHAVPQNILEVEFQLFGSLTIKQFGYIAGGFTLALLCYWIFGKVPIIQWPLSIFFFIIGLMLALWKINEMPFEVWLMNYIAAIFTTQRSIYQKSKKTTSIFDILDKSTSKVTTKRNNYEDSALAAVNANYSISQQNIVDKAEDEDLKDIDSLFSTIFNSKSQVSQVTNNYFETFKTIDNKAQEAKNLAANDKIPVNVNVSKTVTNETNLSDLNKYANSDFPVVIKNYQDEPNSLIQFNSDNPSLLPVIVSDESDSQLASKNMVVQTRANEEFIKRFQIDDVKEPITKFLNSQALPEQTIDKKQDLTSFLQDSATRMIVAKKLEKKDQTL